MKDPFGIRARVRERPLTAAAIAGGTGLAAGWVVAQRGAARRDAEDDAARFGLGALIALVIRSVVLPRLRMLARSLVRGAAGLD